MKKTILSIVLVLIATTFFAQVPANNTCGTAQNLGTLGAPGPCGAGIIYGTSSSIASTNVNATAENPYIFTSCTPDFALSVWYQFTVPTNGFGVVIALTNGGTLSTDLANPEIAVFQGSCSGLASVACLNGASGTGTLTISNGLVVGQTYYIRISGANLTQQHTFNLNVKAFQDCANCLNASHLTINPLPVNGTYQAGQTVSFCYHIDKYTQTNGNWFHGVQLAFGAGWDLTTLTTTPPAPLLSTAAAYAPSSCTGTSCGNWAYYPAGITSSASGLPWPAGFYFNGTYSSVNSGNGNGSGCTFCRSSADGNPGNNFGDGNANITTVTPAATAWNFCFTIKVLPGCNPGGALTLIVGTSGDGESGGWSNTGCAADAPATLSAITACCPPNVGTTSTVTCNSYSNAAMTATAVTGVAGSQAPYVFTWTGPSGPVATNTVAAGTTNSVSGLPAGVYTVVVTDKNSCSATTSYTVTQPAVVPVTASVTNSVICLGNSTTLSGGGASTYTWTGGVTNGVAFSPTVTATYTVTGTSAAGCTNTAVQSVTVNSLPITVASTTGTLTCATTTVALNSTLAGMTYTWTAPSGASVGSVNTQSTTASGAAGTFTIKVVNTTTGCTYTTTTAVTQNTTAPVITASSSSSLNCTTTTATLTGTGGSTYSWTGPGISSGALTATPTVTLGGTYNVTVTAANGCKTATTIAVVQNIISPTVAGATTGSLNCTVLTVNTSATTTTTPVTYAWSGTGITSATNISTITVNQGGTFTYTVTGSNNNCKTINAVAVVQNTTSPTVAGATTGSLNCTVLTVNASATTSTTPVSYVWSGPGIIAGAGTGTITVNQPGTYNYTVTNTFNSCLTTGSQAITQNTTAPTVTVSSNATITCAAPTVTMTGSATPSTCTPVWTGGVSSGATSYTATASSANVFTLTVTNPANGCTAANSVTVSPSAGLPIVSTPVISNSITCALSTAQVTLASTPAGNTYSWSGSGIISGATTSVITVSASGTYSAVVTNTASMCSSSVTAFVPINTVAPTPSATNSTTLTCTTTTATLTGGPGSGVTYQWTGPGFSGGTTSQNAVANAPGTYTLTVTNTVNSCTAVATTAVTQNTTAPSPTASNSTTLTCTTTTAALTGTGGGTYVWSGPGITAGGTTASPTVNAPGTYSVIVTATNGCTATAATTVTQNIIAPSVTGANTGSLNCTVLSINASASTSTTPVSYNWSGPGITGGAGTGTVSVNQGGTYNYTVTNTVNSCTTTGSQAITQNTTAPSVTGANTGSLNCTVLTVNASATTTTIPVSYNWTGTGITSATNISTITVNQGGTFTYTVTNTANNCTTIGSQAIIQNTIAPSVTGANTGSLNCITTTVNVSATTTTTPVSYNWSGTGITSATNISTITVNQGGAFNYTVTNTANTCTTTGLQTIIQNTVVPIVSGTNTGSLNCTVLSVNASATTSTTPVSYNWSGPGITGGAGTGTVSVNQGGTYNYTVTNTANNCTTTGSQAITQNTTAPSVTGANTGSLNCTVLTVNVSATTTTTPVTYNWAGTGITSATTISTITVNQGGTFNYTVTNTANTCTTTGSQAIIQNTIAPTTTAATSGSITCVTNTINLTSSLAGMTYTWTAPSGSSILSGFSLQNAVGQGLGTYSLTVLNTANSCTFQTSVAAIQNTTTPTSVNAGPNQTLVCITPTVSLQGSATPTTATANWLGGVSNPTVFVTSTGAAGVYTLQAIEPTTGCFITSTVTVFQSITSPTVTSNPVTNSITCTNSVVAIGISVTCPDPYTITWPTGTGISGPTNSVTTTATLSGVYQVTVTNTFNSCITINSINVPINITPVTVSITPATSITCVNTTETLNVSPVGANYTYTWTGSGIISGGFTPNPVVNNGGNFNVVVTNTINGCAGTGTVNVPMNISTPTVNISTSSYTTTCANPTVTIVASSTPSTGVTYSWTAPGSGSLSTYTISNPIASGSGIFTVVVTNTVNGCSSSLTQNTVQVTPDLAIPTVTLSTNSLLITCSNPTPSVAVTTTASPVSYSWSPTGGIVSGTGTTATPSFSLAGSYSVVVTNTVSGCATSISSNVVTVSLNNAAPTITLSPSQILTCTTPTANITTTVSPNFNINYVWAGTGVTGLTTSSVNVNQAGVYTTTVTNTVNGCSVTANVSMTSNTVAPTVTVSPNSFTTTCASPTVQLTATTSTSSVTYTWTAPGSGSLNTYTVSNPIATGSGIFTVSVTDASNGCSTALSQATVEVIADAGIPVITLNSNTATITCSNPTPSVVVTTTASPVSYSWSPTSGIVAGTETTATPSFSLTGSYSVVVTNTVSGCATVANIVNVSIDNIAPVITLSSATNSGTITCLSTSVVVTPTVTPNSNLTYTWSTGSGISTPANQASATFTAAGVYTLVVTNTLTGCVSSTATPSTFTVIANTNTPTVSITAISTNTVIGCGVNSSVTYSAIATTANGSASYLWNPGAVVTSTFSATTAGVYSAVVIDAVSGCSTTTQFTVTGNSTAPNLSSNALVSMPCGASSTTLSANSTNTNVSYSWTGPVAAIITGSATSTPTVDAAGNYVVTVTDLATGCSNSNTVAVTQASITASFTANPTSGLSPLTVNFTNQTIGASSYNWSFGNGAVSTSTNPSAIYTSAGTYTVTLIATAGSCTTSATAIIVVEDGLTLVIPNVFTPNKDGTNDVFTILSTGVKEISLSIFNRWGLKLYDFSGPKAAWDGITGTGETVSDGTYFYFVKAVGFDGKEIQKNGTVNLFR